MIDKRKKKKIVLNMDFLELDGDQWICNGIPFTGITRSYSSDGNLETEIELKDGLPNGKWIEYYPEGNKKEERCYENGIIHGQTIKWYASGSVKEISNNECHILLERIEYDENGDILRHVDNLKDNPGDLKVLEFRREHPETMFPAR